MTETLQANIREALETHRDAVVNATDRLADEAVLDLCACNAALIAVVSELCERIDKLEERLNATNASVADAVLMTRRY